MTIEKNELSERFIRALETNIAILIKISSAYAKSYHEREDLISDIIYQMWLSFHSFKGDSKLSTWIYRVALNTCMNYDLKRKKDKLIFSDNLSDFNLHEVIETNISELQRYSVLYECINELDSFNKAIILLYLDGKSHEDISSIIGISLTNVGTRIGRIKALLRNLATKNLLQ